MANPAVDARKYAYPTISVREYPHFRSNYPTRYTSLLNYAQSKAKTLKASVHFPLGADGLHVKQSKQTLPADDSGTDNDSDSGHSSTGRATYMRRTIRSALSASPQPRPVSATAHKYMTPSASTLHEFKARPQSAHTISFRETQTSTTATSIRMQRRPHSAVQMKALRPASRNSVNNSILLASCAQSRSSMRSSVERIEHLEQAKAPVSSITCVSFSFDAHIVMYSSEFASQFAFCDQRLPEPGGTSQQRFIFFEPTQGTCFLSLPLLSSSADADSWSLSISDTSLVSELCWYMYPQPCPYCQRDAPIRGSCDNAMQRSTH